MASVGMDMIQQLHFLRPYWLLALPVAWGWVVWLARRRNRDGNWAKLIDPELLPGLRLAAGTGTHARSPWPWLALAWTLALLALSGPAWQRDATTAWRAPAAWVLLFDLSPSMTATDLAPNRVTRARYAIDDLLSAAHDARVGLVAFGDEAFTVTPLTDDVATVRAMLPALSPDIMPTPGDNLAPALDQALKLLKQTGQKNGQVVLLSDGFADPAAAFAAAQRLHSEGATLNVVGIGSAAGAPLTKPSGGLALDAKGQPRLVRLDTDRLRQLASSGGGRYVDLADLPSLIADLQAKSGRASGAKGVTGVEVEHWRDAGVWLLPVLLLLAAFLGRRGWV
jgi:Ca-activated chloride channel family protein